MLTGECLLLKCWVNFFQHQSSFVSEITFVCVKWNIKCYSLTHRSEIHADISGFVGPLDARKTQSQNWGSAPKFVGGAKFSIGPRLAPAGGMTVLSGPARFLPYNTCIDMVV